MAATKAGQIQPVNIVPEVEKAYVDYAMSVIVSRALPDVRDGLKPVHRRILYAMHLAGITHKSPYKKSARIVGDVLGRFHPHGDAPVYDALVRLAQDFSMRYPLIDGQGNFGSIDGDPPAQMRYTEVRLTKIAQELLADIYKETVGFVDNFDASQQEPTVLPAILPNLLLMGSDGIAVGMATKIPPHNLTEVVTAAIELISQGQSLIPPSIRTQLKDPQTDDPQLLIGEFESAATLDDLLKHIKGPDFPTGAQIYDAKAIAEVYATGRGKIIVQAITEIVEGKNRFQILVTQLPYQVNKARLIAKIADLVRKKRIEGIADIRDESDRRGLTIAIDLKRDAVPMKVLNNLYRHTELQTSFPANFVALSSDLHPRLMNLKQMLHEYIRHRQLVIARRSQFILRDARARAHILEGLLKALDVIDQVIETIKKSPDSDTAKLNLIQKFGFTQIQAEAILEMQLRRLAALERQKIQTEYDQLMELIKNLVAVLGDPKKILSIITDELKYLSATYGDKRRTIVHKNPLGQISDEDLITAQETIVTLTETGYIKRMPVDTFRSQRRGGKGVAGMTKKEEDELQLLLSANTHDHLLVFTNRGRVYQLRVWDLPESSRQAKGQAIVNLLALQPGETIQAILGVPQKIEELAGQYFFFTTRHGAVKRTPARAFANIKSNGLIAINLKSDDELVWVKITSDQDHILLVTRKGKSIRFAETDVRHTGRDTMGVIGINLKQGDRVITMETFTSAASTIEDKRRKFFRDILIVTEKGLGKRTPIAEYPVQKRGGQGVKVGNLTVKTGDLAGALLVNQDSDYLVISTKEALAIKLPIKNIPQLQRPTQGVILIRPQPGDLVSAIAAVPKETEEV